MSIFSIFQTNNHNDDEVTYTRPSRPSDMRLRPSEQYLRPSDLRNGHQPYIPYEERPTKRGTIDRIFGMLGSSAIVEGLYNLTDNDESTGFWQGVGEGIKYMNPFEDDVSGRNSFSDVLKNIGWEDKDPDHLSLSDVGRGVVGFAGDVLLDPLSYINPFSAAGKIAKGTGLGTDAIKAAKKLEQVAEVSGKLDDLKDGTSAVRNLAKLRKLNYDDFVDIASKFDGYTPEEIPAVAEKLFNDYSKDIMHIASGGEDFSFGLNHLPFASKRAQALKKTIVSSDKLREFGDKTIAPYFNDLAKSIRTSKIGQKFSTKNQLEALGITNSYESIAKYHTDQLLKGFAQIGADVDDIKTAAHIEDYWNKLDETQKYAWLQAKETGAFNDASKFVKFRSQVQEAYEKATGNTDDFFSDEKLFSEKGTKKMRKKSIKVDELNNQISEFLEKKKASLSVNDRIKISNIFGKDIKEMTDSELIDSLRTLDKLNRVSSYKDLMNYRNVSNSKFADLRDSVSGYMNEASAYRSFLGLDPAEKKALINQYVNDVSFDFQQLDEWKKQLSKSQKSLDNAFYNSEQYEFYKRMDDLLGTNHMSDAKTVAEKIAHITKQNKNIVKAKGTLNQFDDEALEIADLISERMSKAAEQEVARGLLKKGAAEHMKGRYLEHISKVDKESLTNLLREDKNGVYNPDILGILQKFNKSRNGKTIAEMNKKTELLEDALHEIYLTRAMGSNHLVYGTDVQNFIRRTFGKELASDAQPMAGHSVAVSYKDLHQKLSSLAGKSVDDVRLQLYNTTPKDKLEDVLKEFDAGRDQLFSEEYAKLVKEVASGDDAFVRNYTPNITMQLLNENQRKAVEAIGVTPFQISDNILDRTNVFSRTQKMEQQSSFLNLFDKFQTIWKLNNSLVAPSFHVQNSLSNAYQSFLAIGADAFNIKQIKKAYNIMKLKDPRQTIKLGDKMWTYKELEHTAKKSGVLDELFSTYDFGRQGNTISSFKDVQFRGLKSLNLFDQENFIPYQVNTVAGTNIEGVQRMNLFMSALKQGQSVEEAVETVNKFLFDYGALTDFEQDVMKRVIPFYTFMRKNIPMELEQMLEHPQTFATMDRAFTNIEKMDEENYKNENERNEWRQDYMQIPYTKYGINWQLPYQQLDKFELNEAGMPGKIIGSTSPFIKPFYELPTEEYAYTGINIDNIGEYLMNQSIPTSAMVRTDFSDKDSVQYNLSRLIGFPMAEVK